MQIATGPWAQLRERKFSFDNFCAVKGKVVSIGKRTRRGNCPGTPEGILGGFV